ncbi:hypothetical protein [Pseudomonas sp. N040]|uniref:hypothetical protein n=1 Tax=Pseudomonas sp. N040 TaxID=2785325 RepID=UPI0018A3081B|nr:hypothetical protein [Pseudomonas sp. N040]MBF7730976.1 hypothetical protein [Pseudomonas sp. N040]MBW7014619.1 hypothetical protein [Pseudomonas sp. N040]
MPPVSPPFRPTRRRGLLLALCLLLGLTIWWLMRPTWQHDVPRDLPWAVADYRTAHFSHQTLPDGRIRLQIEHLPLPDISPQMLAWWYRVLPISTVEISGTTYPLYQIFHLSEHGQLWLEEAASDGSPGMGVGALVARREWFGPFDSEGAGRVVSISAAGMTVRPEVAGVPIGEIRHLFSATPTGSQYRVETLIGVDWPLLGPLVNALLRYSTFHEAMLREWERHQIEEVSLLHYYLPQLYAQQAPAYHFTLALP